MNPGLPRHLLLSPTLKKEDFIHENKRERSLPCLCMFVLHMYILNSEFYEYKYVHNINRMPEKILVTIIMLREKLESLPRGCMPSPINILVFHLGS